MTPSPDSVRLFTDDWLHPLPLAEAFPRPQPLEIDLGCGKGRFLLARAAHHPDTNFLGIDRMLRRIRKVDRKAVRHDLHNVRLLRMEAYYSVLYLVPALAVRTYYIFFPDPWPKARHHKNRLFDGPFLDALVRTLEPNGCVHVATDHEPYFEAIDELLQADTRFEAIDAFIPKEEERTDFEQFYVEHKPIHRCSIRKR